MEMVQSILAGLQAAAASRINIGSAKQPEPSALELGAENATYNARSEAVGRVFGRPSSGSIFASLESFLVVAEARSAERGNRVNGSGLSGSAGSLAGNTKTKAGQGDAGKRRGTAGLNGTGNLAQKKDVKIAALDLFLHRETAAVSRLKQLLDGIKNPGPVTLDVAAPLVEEAVEQGASGFLNNSGFSSGSGDANGTGSGTSPPDEGGADPPVAGGSGKAPPGQSKK